MLLEVRGIEVYYGKIQALKGISLEVNEGEIVTIIGANGAGKTTTLKTISGLRKLKAGAIYYNGEDISHVSPHKRVEMGIGHVPEGRGIFPGMTVTENLEMGAFARPRAERSLLDLEFDRVFELFPRLRERASQHGGTLSGGEQQMLAIGRAMMSSPKILLLDEPSMGLAPMLVAQVFETIREINAGGTTVLLIEQNAQQALKTAQRAYLMETGSMIRHAPCEELLGDESVKNAYLGGDIG